MREFDHERMEVYRLAIAFVRTANGIRPALLAGRSALADQLDRAAVSIALNIAEGAGEFARREKARFYRIARRSATECAAILDVIRELDLVERDRLREAKSALQIIVPMLIGLGKWAEKESPQPEPQPKPQPSEASG
jgi:four helix bundle protein